MELFNCYLMFSNHIDTTVHTTDLYLFLVTALGTLWQRHVQPVQALWSLMVPYHASLVQGLHLTSFWYLTTSIINCTPASSGYLAYSYSQVPIAGSCQHQRQLRSLRHVKSMLGPVVQWMYHGCKGCTGLQCKLADCRKCMVVWHYHQCGTNILILGPLVTITVVPTQYSSMALSQYSSQKQYFTSSKAVQKCTLRQSQPHPYTMIHQPTSL